MRVLVRKFTYISSLSLVFFLWNCTTTSDMSSDEDSLVAEEMGAETSGRAYGENDPDVMSLQVKRVHFDFDQAIIKDEFKEDLGKIAGYLKRNPKATLRVAGHCDEKGTPEYNLALGYRRAGTVKKFLVTLGVEKSRLSTTSYGKEDLLDKSGTAAGDYKNRRAEFKLSGSTKRTF